MGKVLDGHNLSTLMLLGRSWTVQIDARWFSWGNPGRSRLMRVGSPGEGPGWTRFMLGEVLNGPDESTRVLPRRTSKTSYDGHGEALGWSRRPLGRFWKTLNQPPNGNNRNFHNHKFQVTQKSIIQNNYSSAKTVTRPHGLIVGDSRMATNGSYLNKNAHAE